MTTAPPRPRPILRRWSDVLLLAAGLAVLVLAALPVRGGPVSGAEAAVFRALNATTVLPFVAVWPVMQLGNFLAVPAAAVVAAGFRLWLLAVELLLAGVGVYVLAKVVKRVVVRGRPDEYLADVVHRGAPAHGLGFVSGHAAVVAALLVVAWPRLNRPARIACTALAVVVCLSRIYVSAHLPLDVVGGAALGLAVGAGVRVLLGRPR